jgi:3-oxoadipate enol-lactonase
MADPGPSSRVELWHEAAGEGDPPVLLLHAGICDARMWGPQRDALTARRRTIRCDLRGYGRSELAPEGFSHAGDVAALLERLGSAPAAVVGASFGGLVALDLALGRPDLVERLVLADAPLADHEWSPEVRAFFEREEELLEAGDVDAAVELNLRFWLDRSPGAAPELRERVGAMQRRAFELQLPLWDYTEDELLAEGPSERLGELAVPALVVTGEHDVEDFVAIADRIAAGIADARRETIAGAGHLPSLERPEEFNELLLAFL